MQDRSPSLLRQIFWMIVVPIAAIVGAKAATLHYMDRSLTTSPPTLEEISGNASFPRADGSWPDYRALFDARQEAELTPAEENGWKKILQAFGPRALDRESLTEGIAWEELASNERSNDWFAESWAPLCEKFEIDPNSKPAFYDRLDLRSYLCKHGITGREEGPKTQEDVEKFPVYWEGTEKKIGRVPADELDSCLARLESNPWPAALFPNAARWIEENADVYDVCSAAVRSPKFGSWRFLAQGLGKVKTTDTSDLKGMLTIARLFTARANYRIAEGDVSGAIDDVESILLEARFLLDSNNLFWTDRLAALHMVETGASIGIYANPAAQPTPDETARWIKLWRDRFGAYDFEEALKRAYASVRDVVSMTTAQELCAFRREQGSAAALFAELTDDETWKDKAESERRSARLRKTFLFRPTFDDQYLMETLARFIDSQAQTLNQEELNKLTLQDAFDKGALKNRRVESGLALDLFNDSILSADAVVEEFRRACCIVRTHCVVNALLAYQQEHGTLPPAYTVDALNKPLHSWRVLILPYLGEEELYEKFALDEPWNSETNAPLQQEAPSVYRCMKRWDEDLGVTSRSVVLGQDALFGYGGAARDLVAMRKRPGVYTNLQALVVERAAPICWTRPDAELDAHNCRETFGRRDGVLDMSHMDGVIVGSANGATYWRNARPDRSGATNGEIAELLITGRGR